MDWCVDTRVPGAARGAEDHVCAHLARHAIDSTLVELARPVVRATLAGSPAGPLWVGVDWTEQWAVLHATPLAGSFLGADGPLPGTALGPGITVANEHAARLIAAHGAGTDRVVELGVARPPERSLDPEPADSGISVATPGAVMGLVASGLATGRDMAEAAARAGATVAGAVAAGAVAEPVSGSASDGVAAVADAFIAAERGLGGDFHLVSLSGRRAVVANRRCPFGSPPKAMCRFTSALAGSLGARAAGAAEVTLDESLAEGDHQCRLVIDLGEPAGRLTSHPYRWPPAGLDADPPPGGAQPGAGFQVTLALQLPRDRLSVPVTRHLVRASMTEVGVVEEDAAAVELAVTEACANVVDHSGPGDAYEVQVSLGATACHIRVVDVGRGFDHESFGPEMAGLDSERGRGVALMHALVDHVRFESRPERGTVVHLVKRLRFDDSVPARRLMLDASGQAPPEVQEDPLAQ